MTNYILDIDGYQRYILALPEFGEKRYRYIIFVWKGDLNVESNQYLF